MRLFSRPLPMPRKFDALATYNAEKARGLLHAPQWVERMEQLQSDFDHYRAGLDPS